MTTPAAGLIRYQVGDRVQLHPSLDAWMRGDRYGTVERIPRSQGARERNVVYVRMDRSTRLQRIHLSNLLPIDVGG